MRELIPTISNFSSSTFTYNSSFSCKWTYDVFLNFRGEDTRYGFTGHLYHALYEKGIHTFIDNRLDKGKEITQALLEAIDKSRIAIVILSVNYASSTFCLDELVKIFEFMEQKRGLVLPIFYKVDPSDVRHQRGSYGEALARHEENLANCHERIQKWRSALQEAANLSGWHFKEGDRYEYEFIKEIVEKVSKKINPTLLPVAKYPVGLKSRVDVVISLLHLKSTEEVVTVGIYGIGGIGKTTIACEVHNAIIDQFEGVCFLFDVRERSNNGGLIELQETLLFELIGEKGIKIGNVRKGIPIIKRRLCQKRVLLILDDVDNQEQLRALAGGVDWFGMGSRIIITTRDKHLLDVYAVSRNYEVKQLCSKEALELFSWNAFKRNEVDSRYASISLCVTNYCDGLPLALEIIGSNLFGKTQREWESALDTYKSIPDKNIQSVLEVSYNGLDENEKEIFLDIACFFNGYYLEDVEDILLNGRGYDPQYGIGVLVKKSLIKIDKQKKVKIHDLMVQMGQEIVRSQFPSNPENWSRLWNSKDIFHILEDDMGTDKIGALALNMIQEKKLVHWNGKAFKKMKNLKILIIEGALFSCAPKYLPNTLRVLRWKNYYSSSNLPRSFHSKNLAILDLCESSIQLVKPLKNFEALTEMTLRDCKFLKQVLDVSGAPSLRILDVSNCQNLIEVHHSVGSLDKLVLLEAYRCTNLRILPHSIKSASLQCLDLSWCFGIKSVPEIVGVENNFATPYYDSVISLEDGSLCLYKLDSGWYLDCGILMLPKLESWNGGFEYFDKCSSNDQEKMNPAIPTKLTIHTSDHDGQKNYFRSTLDFDWNNLTNRYFSAWRPFYTSLIELNLPFCNLRDDFFYQQLPWFPNLRVLDVSENKFTILPECMIECHCLWTLLLDYCKELQEIREIPPNIKYLLTADCTLLSSPSSSKLLSQNFHKDGGKHVIVPGIRIPKWLDHSCMGSSISFQFRNEFPRLALCYIGYAYNVKFRIFINGILALESTGTSTFNTGTSTTFDTHSLYETTTPCISILDVQQWGDAQRKVVLKQNEWNHVLVLTNKKYIFRMGVHVYMEDTEGDNFRFKDRINDNLDLIAGFSLQKKFCPFLGMLVCDTIDSMNRVKSSYHFLNNEESFAQSPRAEYIIRKEIWMMKAPTKVKVLMCQIWDNSLPTCHNFFTKKLVNSPMCPICGTEVETSAHVFMYCQWTVPIWFGSGISLVKNTNEIHFWFAQTFLYIHNIHPNAERVIGLMGSICWAIWKGRNDFVLSNKPVDPWEALMTAKAMHMSYSTKFSFPQTNCTHIGPTLKPSTDTNHQDNVKGIEVEYKAKQKGKLARKNNTEMKPTCDKDKKIDAIANA